MPRARKPAYSQSGPSDDDLAEFQAAMGPLLSTMGPPELPSAQWSRLCALVVRQGYTISLSPALGGSAYKIGIPMGEKRIEVYISDQATASQVVDQLLLAAQRLPKRG